MGTKPPYSHLMGYKIGRGETGVLTYQPYKSQLLPYWRFKTVPIAKESSKVLYQKFLEYHDDDNFPGMDMARKFIQMGMTRAKRYANYKGGRKYVAGKEDGRKIEKSKGHEGKDEKEKASLVFREVWERCKEHEGYQRLKKEFLEEQKAWEKLTQEERDRVRADEDVADLELGSRSGEGKVKGEKDAAVLKEEKGSDDVKNINVKVKREAEEEEEEPDANIQGESKADSKIKIESD